MTYGPGEEVWEWFGHNAIWLRDESQGLDHTYSFGYFDIDGAGFYWRFALGDMRYFGSAISAQREFEFYRRSNRSIRVQGLALTDAQFDRLHTLLTHAIYPYPRYYEYDYFLSNCSTWLRDLLNETLAGELAKYLNARPAEKTYRQHTAEKTSHHFLTQLGLMTVLGPRADNVLTQWEEAFLPAVLADQLTELTLNDIPLVESDRMLYQKNETGRPASAGVGSAQLGQIGLLFGFLVVLPLLIAQRWTWWPYYLSAFTLGLSGTVVMFLWLFTAHDVARPNYLVTLLNPVWFGLLPIWPSFIRKISGFIAVAVLLMGMLIWALGIGPGQSPMMLLFFFPIAMAIFLTHYQSIKSEGY